MAAPVVTGTVALMLEANPDPDAERGQGAAPVHRPGPGRRALRWRRAPACSTPAAPSGWRGSSPIPSAARRRPADIIAGEWSAVGPPDCVGQRARRRRHAAAGEQRLGARRHLGRGNDAGRRADHVGRELRRQHRLEHRRRQHRLEHQTTTTSSGARSDDNIVWSTADADNIVWSTAHMENVVWGRDCGGANCRRTLWGSARRGRHHLGHRRGSATTSSGAPDDDNIVWSTSEAPTTSSGARARTSSGAPTTTTSSGARATTTSSGARRRDNIVWSTGDDNIVWSTINDVAASTEQRDRRRHRRGPRVAEPVEPEPRRHRTGNRRRGHAPRTEPAPEPTDRRPVETPASRPEDDMPARTERRALRLRAPRRQRTPAPTPSRRHAGAGDDQRRTGEQLVPAQPTPVSRVDVDAERPAPRAWTPASHQHGRQHRVEHGRTGPTPAEPVAESGAPEPRPPSKERHEDPCDDHLAAGAVSVRMRA